MNWKQIKEKYPKAIDKCFHYGILTCSIDNRTNEVIEYSLSMASSGGFTPNIRNLYDFFDENGVYIEVFMHAFTPDKGWESDIYSKDDSVHIEKSSTRTEAEQAAFEKAFEILETKLK